jgi:poly-beta-1,6-N-acetyl-D-glucosamine synthase
MIITLSAVIFLYGVFIAFVWRGWLSLLKYSPQMPASEAFISVIVAVRNEQKTIRNLLKNLTRQQYSAFEIIVVNDHSDDDTERIVRDFESPFVKCIQNQGTGKKQAITTGVAIANGTIIATTDGDCSIPSTWLPGINRFFSEDIQMVIGPVTISGEGNLFSHMQQIEFASLIGTAAATSAYEMPIMCNGANLAFKRELFHKVGGFEGNKHIPSGDDEFLMRKFLHVSPGSIRFAADKNCVVSTVPHSTIGEFLQQRLRWAGKWRYNSSFFALLVALFVLSVQIVTIIGYFELIRTGNPGWLAIILIRFVLDVTVLQAFCNFLGVRWRWIAFLLLFLIYPFYVFYVALASNFLSFSWKGRLYER